MGVYFLWFLRCSLAPHRSFASIRFIAKGCGDEDDQDNYDEDEDDGEEGEEEEEKEDRVSNSKSSSAR